MVASFVEWRWEYARNPRKRVYAGYCKCFVGVLIYVNMVTKDIDSGEDIYPKENAMIEKYFKTGNQITMSSTSKDEAFCLQ